MHITQLATDWGGNMSVPFKILLVCFMQFHCVLGQSRYHCESTTVMCYCEFTGDYSVIADCRFSEELDYLPLFKGTIGRAVNVIDMTGTVFCKTRMDAPQKMIPQPLVADPVLVLCKGKISLLKLPSLYCYFPHKIW